MTRSVAQEITTGIPLWRQIATAVAGQDVEVVFGLMGLANMQLVVELQSGLGIAYHSARHESGAVSMADGYARATGRVGVCTVTQGPGVSNALTSLLEAQRSRTPLVLLAGQAPAGAGRDNQYLPQDDFLRSVGLAVAPVANPARVTAAVEEAFLRAVTEQRPVVVNIPFDLQQLSVAQEPAPLPAPQSAPEPAPEVVERLVALLADARNPILLAGRGCSSADAARLVRAVAAAVGALLMTTAPVKGLLHADTHHIGVAGGFTTRRGVELIAESDLIVCLGASLNDWTTRAGKLFPPGATVVQVDTDRAAIGRYLPVGLGVVGDARGVLRAVLTRLERRQVSREGRRTEALAAELRAGLQDCWTDASSENDIDPRRLVASLDEMLPANRTLAAGDGLCFGWSMMGFDVPDDHGWLMMQGYQSLGHAVSAAVGAAIGRPDRISVATVGDGGLMMGLSELETAARVGAPLLVVVFNDSAYGAEVFHLTHHFGGLPTDAARFPDTDFASIADDLGCRGLTVRRPADLDAVRTWLEEPTGVLLVDAKITPGVVSDWMFA